MLTREAFELRDEGKLQPIIQFDNTPQPIRLIVMLDVSGSMEGNLPLLRAAASGRISAPPSLESPTNCTRNALTSYI